METRLSQRVIDAAEPPRSGQTLCLARKQAIQIRAAIVEGRDPNLEREAHEESRPSAT